MTPPLVPAVALQGGDVVELLLPDGNEICEIRRIVQPRASQVVLIDYRLASGAVGQCHLLNTDLVLRLRENLAKAAA